MTILVADVGGTNSRLAIVANDEFVSLTSSKFSNREFSSFYEVIKTFLAQQNLSKVSACVVAMAGPVFAGQGKLTNHDWEISTKGLRTTTGAPRAIVMNDLTALGYAVGQLQPNELTPILARTAVKNRNGQSLIVGIGTGFNVCPVKTTRSSVTICLEAEGGHIGLSPAVLTLLQAEVGLHTKEFHSAEDLFSGRGLARLHLLRVGIGAELSAGQIVQAHTLGTDADATSSLRLYAKLIGAHCRELLLQYLPLNGIYFAGSVARGVMGAGLSTEFASEFNQHARFEALFSQVPISIINEDAAALVGCAAASRLQL